MPNPLCHFEFAADDPARCMKFYGSLFDWEFDSQSMPGYTLIKTGAEPGGGLMKTTEQMPGPCFTVYFLVDDIQETCRKAERAGGHVLVPETPIPGVGFFALLKDPEDVHFGLFRAQHG